MSNKYPDMRQLMNVITEEEVENSEQLAAISQLIADRTEDEDSESKISTHAFISIANKMGIPLTDETLMDLVEKGTLESVIKDASPDEIHFKGQKDIDPEAMDVERAEKVVSDMASKAAKKGVKNEGEEEDKKRRDDIADWNKEALDKHNAEKEEKKGVNESNVHDTMKSLIQLTESVDEGYRTLPPIDRERYTDIPGLEGPYVYKSGKVLYYDPQEGKYYDRDTDMYLSHEEFQAYDDYGTTSPRAELEDWLKYKKGGKGSEVNEDWGSSDWYGVIKSMDEYVDKHGMNPSTIKDAAREAAIFWGDAMGHDMKYRDGEENAIEDCIAGWMRMSKRGQQLQKMFAPK